MSDSENGNTKIAEKRTKPGKNKPNEGTHLKQDTVDTHRDKIAQQKNHNKGYYIQQGQRKKLVGYS